MCICIQCLGKPCSLLCLTVFVSIKYFISFIVCQDIQYRNTVEFFSIVFLIRQLQFRYLFRSDTFPFLILCSFNLMLLLNFLFIVSHWFLINIYFSINPAICCFAFPKSIQKYHNENWLSLAVKKWKITN